jgi:hypothetical protein
MSERLRDAAARGDYLDFRDRRMPVLDGVWPRPLQPIASNCKCFSCAAGSDIVSALKLVIACVLIASFAAWVMA